MPDVYSDRRGQWSPRKWECYLNCTPVCLPSHARLTTRFLFVSVPRTRSLAACASAHMLDLRNDGRIVGQSSSFRRLSTPYVAGNSKNRAGTAAVVTQINSGSVQTGSDERMESSLVRCLLFNERHRSWAHRQCLPVHSSSTRRCGCWCLCRSSRLDHHEKRLMVAAAPGFQVSGVCRRRASLEIGGASC